MMKKVNYVEAPAKRVSRSDTTPVNDTSNVSYEETYNVVTNQIKAIFDVLSELISYVLQKHGIEKRFADEIPREDFRDYLVYISEFEFENQYAIADFLTRIFDELVTPEMIEEIADEPENLTSKFEEGIPISFTVAVEYDDEIWTLFGEREASMALRLLEIYKAAAEVLIDTNDPDMNANYKKSSDIFMNYIMKKSRLARYVMN